MQSNCTQIWQLGGFFKYFWFVKMVAKCTCNLESDVVYVIAGMRPLWVINDM